MTPGLLEERLKEEPMFLGATGKLGHQPLGRKDGCLWIGALVSMAPFGFVWGTGAICSMSLGWCLHGWWAVNYLLPLGHKKEPKQDGA